MQFLLSALNTAPKGRSLFRRAAYIVALLLLPLTSVCAARDVNLAEAFQAMQTADSDFHIVDVRSRQEYEQGHVPGAINMDVADPNFPLMLQELPKNASVVVYCRSGRRSAVAVRIMESLGYIRILHMKDGWLAWEKAGLPSEKQAH
ncbi:MAG: rhodanese-like domain-containing protein [Desulfovibrio sp.]|nr:rhodanese-like domain-containing protein [Desulfovibrio sp.]